MAEQAPIRVLVVEDSPAQLALVTSVLHNAGGFAISGVAANGRAAVSAACSLRPQVVAMDIHLPVFDGYEATRQIMQRCPTPIVLMSSSTGDAARRSLDALAAGALAVVRKPGSPLRAESAAESEHFVRTLRLMAGVRVVTRHAPRVPPARPMAPAERPIELLAIAASTGGPAALQTLLRGLGAALPLPVLVVQHIAQGFSGALIDWLRSVVPQPLLAVEHAIELQPGRVYFAADNRHVRVVRRGVAGPQRADPADRYCPSADLLFTSVAEQYGARVAGVIMTGMGDDGAQGLAALRRAGAPTFGQDAASCVVYGMPRAAMAAGAVGHELALEQLAPALLGLIGSRSLTRG